MASSRRSDLVIRVRYANPLPPPPFPPKLLNIATDPKRYARVQFTSALSNDTPLPVVVDSEVGMPLDLSLYDCLWDGSKDDSAINPSYPDAPADPRDAFLLEGYDNSSIGGPKVMPNVSWLRKTEYLSRDSSTRSHMAATEVKTITEAPVDISRAAQIRDIEATFPPPTSIDNPVDLTLLTHPTKPGLTAVASYEVLPDSDLWANSYDIFRFSERPGERPVDQPDPRLDCAILRPMESDGDHFLAYYLPNEDSDALLFKERRQTEEGLGMAKLSLEDDPILPEGESSIAFKFIRDYETARIEQDVDKEFLIVFDDEEEALEAGRQRGNRATTREVRGAYYTPIQRKITLKKRRTNKEDDRVGVILLSHAPFTEEEASENKEALAEVVDPTWLSRMAEEGDATLDAEGEVDTGMEVDDND